MAALDLLQAGDTLVVNKPDWIARSMKELLVLLEEQLHARGINLHILTGICAGTHRPNDATIADKMLFMVAAMAAEMERDLIRTHPGRLDGGELFLGRPGDKVVAVAPMPVCWGVRWLRKARRRSAKPGVGGSVQNGAT